MAASSSSSSFTVLKTSKTFGVYDVTFYNHRVRTTVTTSPAIVDFWIADIIRRHRLIYNQSVCVGLEIEWYHRDNNVAVIQLCIGRRCLVFQVLQAKVIPLSLAYFLGNPSFTFVGVGIQGDVDKLMEHCKLRVASAVDLRSVAVSKYPDRNIDRMGLKAMARELLQVDMEKPQRVTFSRWDSMYLTAAQIEYACIDAFVSFQLGMLLSFQ